MTAAPRDFPHATTFAELDFSTRCCWVVSEEPRLFCGNVRDAKRPYCQHHCELSYTEDRHGRRYLPRPRQIRIR